MDLPVSADTSSAAETEDLGRRFASVLGPGMRVVVSGEIGAGKTSFIRGACRGLGIEAAITSPTFTIARRYEDGALPVSHLDLHRLEGGFEDEDPGLLDGEFAAGRVTFVEWPQVAPLEWLAPHRSVRIEHSGADTRRVTIE